MIETPFDRAVQRAIDQENKRALNPRTVKCDRCGEQKEPTRIDGLYFEPGTTLRHRCTRVELTGTGEFGNILILEEDGKAFIEIDNAEHVPPLRGWYESAEYREIA